MSTPPLPKRIAVSSVIKKTAERLMSPLSFPLLPTLEFSKERLELILRGIADGITLQAPDGTLIYANEPAALVTGYASAEELLHEPVENIMGKFEIFDEHGKSLPMQNMPSRLALMGNPSEQLLQFRIRATGEERWSLLKSTPVKDAQGQVEYVINIFHDLTERKRNEENALFLSDATSILSSSLDYTTTLVSLARLVVPKFADWCVVHIVDNKGIAQNVAVEHVNPQKVKWARDLDKKYPHSPDEHSGVYGVFKSGVPELYTDISDDMVKMSAQNDEHLAILRELGMRSVMIVPMVANGKVLGTISFIAAESNKNYRTEDLKFAENLGGRAALAIENARLYREAQFEIEERIRVEKEVRHLNEVLEQKVEQRTHALQISQKQDRASLQRFKNVIAQLPMGALVLDEKNYIIEVNQNFCDFFKLSDTPHALVGRHYFEFLDSLQSVVQQPAEYTETFHAIFQNRQLVLNQEILLRDGRILFRDYVPIMDDQTFLGQIFLYRDVTRDKRIDAAKSEFMSLASHQLRTPLTTIRWALGRLQKAENFLQDSHRNMLSAARNATVVMADTINAMLTVSRVEAGHILPKSMKVNVATLIEDIHEESAAICEEKHLNFLLSVEGDPVIETDGQLLKEIISNLIRNSIQYTKENGSIRVNLVRASHHLEIQVIDTGVGIPAHQQERIFQKFFRADNAILRQPDGTGLGLYLAFIMAKLLHSSVSFVSEEGEGTTFSVTLPFILPASV
ncbi:MAG: multi-sensor signal transduction histidine kinase [Candidatus Peribacteria bacterium]|nr:multi-sensor signal transduction histidine kinase [Candidatus Peribacteria bacterium]